MSNECIPLYTPAATVTAQVTGADVKGKTFVNISGAMAGGLPKVATAAAKALKFGVAVRDGKAGGRVPVIRAKGVILPVVAGAAFAAGDELEIAAGGKVIKWVDGAKVARALDAATAADTDVFVELY
ncbi:minor capsid protein [Mycobacterium Phage Nergal]|nr:minor capsid protein [Mycobacterium Phage Nergal]